MYRDPFGILGDTINMAMSKIEEEFVAKNEAIRAAFEIERSQTPGWLQELVTEPGLFMPDFGTLRMEITRDGHYAYRVTMTVNSLDPIHF
jgi:hypothetical protein